MSDSQKIRNIIVDSLIVALSASLELQLTLQSVEGAQYAGAGFNYGNQYLLESLGLLVIFALGVSRLVIDLRSR